MSTTTVNPSTDLSSAQQNVLNGVTAEVAARNIALLADYNVVWANYCLRVASNQLNAGSPPQPPNSYVVGYYQDPVNPNTLWAECSVGTTPICPMPPLPTPPSSTPPTPPKPSVSTDWTQYVVGSVIPCPVGDTMYTGYQFTDPAGGVWQKEASNTPVGTAHYYLRIS